MVENDLFLLGPTCNSTGLKGNQMKDISWPENRKCANIFICIVWLFYQFIYKTSRVFLDFFFLALYLSSRG